MALTKGTNCGFVTEAPTADPAVNRYDMDTLAHALKDVAPGGAARVTEMGWWCDTASEAADFEVGIYDHNAADNNPEDIVGKSSPTAKGTTAGWKKVSGLNIAITPGSTYWLAVQLDDTATLTEIDTIGTAGEKGDRKTSMTQLPLPWGVSGATTAWLVAIYALVETYAPKSDEKNTGIRKQSITAEESNGLYDQ